jgi:hypothetical protein
MGGVGGELGGGILAAANRWLSVNPTRRPNSDRIECCLLMKWTSNLLLNCQLVLFPGTKRQISDLEEAFVSRCPVRK